MPTLHTLLTAIDDYPPSVAKLSGCLNDSRAMDEYLSAYAALQGWSYRPLKLHNQQATRQGIINAFQHFEAAQDGDLCVWAYSGHGSRAPAPSAFWHQSPGHLHECLVCWDSREPGGRELLDKELSWLVWKATKGKQLHFLVLMDCCFSGTNLRLHGSQERRVAMRKDARPLLLEDYLGFADYQKEGGGFYTPPRGTYLHLAASRSNQPAREMGFEEEAHGVFTYALLQQLKEARMPVSYAELYQRVHARVSSLVPEQSPQFDHFGSAHLRQPFLQQGHPIAGGGHWVYYRKTDNQWVLNRGSLDGITPDGPEEASVSLPEAGATARVRQVQPSFAIVEPGQALSQDKVYSTRLNRRQLRMLKVALAPDFPAARRSAVEAAFANAAPEYLEWAADPMQALHWVRLGEKGELRLYPRGGLRPKFKGVPLHQAERFWEEADKLGRWEYLRWLSNPESRLPKDALAFELYQMATAISYTHDSPRQEVCWPEPLRLDYRFLEGDWCYPAFQVKITNTSDRELWVGALFLGNDYSIDNDVLPKVHLQPGESAWLRHEWKGEESTIIRNAIEKSLLDIGVTRNPETIKIIASTEEVFLERYNQEGLLPDAYRSLAAGGRESRQDVQYADWAAYDIELVTRRPMDKKRLSAYSPAECMGHRLEAEGPFSAMCTLSTLEDIEEQLSKPIRPGQSEGGDLTPYSWAPGFNQAPALRVLALEEAESREALSAARPLRIFFPERVPVNSLLPLGYGPDSGNLSLLPHSRQAGQLCLFGLPEAAGLKSGGKEALVFLYHAKV